MHVWKKILAKVKVFLFEGCKPLTITLVAGENALDGVLVLTTSLTAPSRMSGAVHATPISHGTVRPTEQSTNGADGRGGRPVTETFLDEAVANFPGKDTWILLAVVFNPLLNVRRCYTRFAAADDARTDGARFLGKMRKNQCR